MTKVVHCREIGFDCDSVVRAETDGELLAQVATHTEAVHDLEYVTCEVIEKVRNSTRDE